MRSAVLAVFVAAGLLAACSTANSDLPEFESERLVAKVSGPVALAAGPEGVYFADPETGAISLVETNGGRPTTVGTVFDDSGTDSIRGLAVSQGRPSVSFVDSTGRLRVVRVVPGRGKSVWMGPRIAAGVVGGRLAGDNRDLFVGVGGKILRVAGETAADVSDRWAGPVAVALDGRGRLWAIDAGSGNERARVARAKTRDRAKRHRFATFLPEGANPVGAAADEFNVYVCDRATKRVLRFYIGLDDVARRRPPVPRLRCEHDIAVTPDGSIVTATDTAILRYRRR